MSFRASLPELDPRVYQIACLSSLLALGVGWLRFDLEAWHPMAVLLGAFGAQAIGTALVRAAGGVPVSVFRRDAPARGFGIDLLSPTITALSLSLLLRTDAVWLSIAAGALAVGSKFALRWRGRHVFNPANLALVALPAAGFSAWISPGQWGSDGLLAALAAGAGAMVAGRAARLDTALAFLGAWAALAIGRAAWFGDPMTIPLHQLQSGALIVFAFFMITDPATTPASRPARILHGGAVAGLGFALQTLWIVEAGAIWALILTAPIVALSRPRPAPSFPAPAQEIASCREPAFNARLAASLEPRPARFWPASSQPSPLRRMLSAASTSRKTTAR